MSYRFDFGFITNVSCLKYLVRKAMPAASDWSESRAPSGRET